MNSHSSTSQFNQCPYAWHLSRDLKLQKTEVGAESNYQQWGKAGHAALEYYYRGKLWSEIEDVFSENYPTDLDPENMAWTRESGSKMLEAYVRRYQEQDSDWEVLEVEHEKPAEDENDMYGHLIIDLIARQKSTGCLYFWDHKFKAKFYGGTIKQYEVDAQISRYTTYVRDKFGECAGAVINVIVPGHRKKAYRGEPAGFHYTFERITVNRTQDQLDFWYKSQRDWDALISHCRLTETWPRHYGHNCSYCEFYELCFSAANEDVITTLYDRKFDVVVE